MYSGVRRRPLHRGHVLLPITSGNPTETWKKAWEITGLHDADRTGLDVVSLACPGYDGPLDHTLMNLPSRRHAAAKGVPADFSGARVASPSPRIRPTSVTSRTPLQGLQKLQMADELPNRIYNVAAGEGKTNQQLADAVKDGGSDRRAAASAGRRATIAPRLLARHDPSSRRRGLQALPSRSSRRSRMTSAGSATDPVEVKSRECQDTNRVDMPAPT